MNWDLIVTKVSPHVLRISTPSGHGTGFLYLHNEDKSIWGIATAAHVLHHADDWQEPIRIEDVQLNNIAFLKSSQRIIYFNWKTDSAVILFQPGAFRLPGPLIPLRPMDSPLSIGAEVGWLGFPGIEPYTLCFFSGNVSARPLNRNAYLIDGVAINGVSGGPVLYCTGADGVQVVGIITAYQANRQAGGPLPGLSIAQDVSHFHDIIQHVRTMDDAQKNKTKLDVGLAGTMTKDGFCATLLPKVTFSGWVFELL